MPRGSASRTDDASLGERAARPAIACIHCIHEALDNPCHAAVLSLTMSTPTTDSAPEAAAPADTCAQCAKTLRGDDTIAAGAARHSASFDQRLTARGRLPAPALPPFAL